MAFNNILKTWVGLVLASTCSVALSFGGAPAKAENDNTAIANHQKTWAYKAYHQQALLDNAVPIAQGYNTSAHNAYNSSAYSSVVYIDPNHTLSMTEQLEIGVRNFELDVHWVWQTKDIPHGDALLLCHSRNQRVGCSGLERYFSDAVAEVNDWLRKNPREVVYLGFEDFWDNRESEMIAALSPLDDLVYKPGSCTSFIDVAKTLTEEDILKAGKQVVILNGDCATTAWAATAYKGGWGYTSTEAALRDDCLIANASWNGGGVQRIFEQDTFFGSLGTKLGIADDNGLYSDATIRKAMRCGVNQIAYDKLIINDPGIKASIWSWAENEPSGGDAQDCGFVRDNGRYYDGKCNGEGSYYVCKAGPNDWKVTAAYGDWSDNADGKCKSEFGQAYSFSMPTNSMQNEHVKAAMNGKPHAWVNYTDSGKEGLWLTPSHVVDYTDGTIKLKALKVGLSYEFYMRATHNNCELQWQGGDKGAGERNAKFDCLSKGDLMKFIPDAEPQVAEDGTVSVHGVIKTIAGGYVCGLEWDGSISGGERNAKFDCSGSADPLTIISKSDGSTERVVIKSDNNCGLQWAGGDANSDGERNAKFDCDPAYDEMTLYGVKFPSEYRDLRNAASGKCIDLWGGAAVFGAEVKLHDCHGGNNQKWKYESATGYIRSMVNADFCLDNRGQTHNGGSLTVHPCMDHNNLRWDFVGNSIRSRNNTSIAIDAYGTSNGSQVGQWSYHGGANQQWSWGD